MRDFKNKVENFDLVGKTAKIVYLWTEKGALLHAKSINTDKAWEVYNYLVDFYFRANGIVRKQDRELENEHMVVDAPDNPLILSMIKKIKNDIICMEVLLDNCIKYISEESYIERRRMASEIVSVLITDMSRFLKENPNIVKKL